MLRVDGAGGNSMTYILCGIGLLLVIVGGCALAAAIMASRVSQGRRWLGDGWQQSVGCPDKDAQEDEGNGCSY